MKTPRGQEVEFWEPRKRENRSKPWELRWRVDDRVKSKSFKTKALAQNREKALHAAARDGEAFDPVTCEPVSWLRSAETFFAHAIAFTQARWVDSAPKTRSNRSEMLMRLILAHVDAKKVKKTPAPASDLAVRRAIVNYGLSFTVAENASGQRTAEPRKRPAEVARILAWVESVSRPVAELGDLDTVTDVVDATGAKLVGKGRCSPTTMRNRRKILRACLQHAVARGIIASNPLMGVRFQQTRKELAVNPHTTPDLEQVQRILGAVVASPVARDRRLVAFFGIAALTGMRPGELRALRADEVTWPQHMPKGSRPGWGRLTASSSRADIGELWTDDGGRVQARELKQRGEDEVRPIPLPPEGAALLRWHLDEFGAAPDGRLFSLEEGDDVHGDVYRRAWERARKTALTDDELTRGVGKRVYDLRHCHASTLINVGVPTTEIARRLGHSVEVLLTTYVHWFTHLEDEANALIDQVFADHGPITGHLLSPAPEPPETPSSEAQ
ncbi:tyrosine-type recombinase/integrase [Nocardiopsis sediminis]|uniref:Tyrosine-type recombinase/integrase n=1 Tax=Nocardiopsis sediminis TaxID=1778267 RepID=A0ABV8FGU7_9ACTN